MDATKQTLALKGTCLLSAILGIATPVVTATGVEMYLYKSCVLGTCANYGSKHSTPNPFGPPVVTEVPFPNKLKAALAFICLALVVSLVQTVLHFTAKPPNHALLGNLSIPNAFFFLLSFALVASDDPTKGGGNYGAGFAFMIIGMLTAVAHFAVSKKAAASS